MISDFDADLTEKIYAVRLRAKNQITLPNELVCKFELEQGDRLFIHLKKDGRIVLSPELRSYAGILRGMFKDEHDIEDYLREERASWGE
jgi:bifunctional DNA-binding transcriptional regulator/antitoxin component of YhaV-PrlF toxin-antitoxin module